MSSDTATGWDPGHYLRFGSERARPFLDLVARVGATEPAYVVDLGCGPGTLTRLLAQRWPAARVDGVDSSTQMIESARPLAEPGRLEFHQADLRAWRPRGPVDVLVSNATLQWIPEHLELLAGLAEWLAPGGWLAFQVPGNFDQPSHAILGELSADDRWSGELAGVDGLHRVPEPGAYLETLLGLGLDADVWETTYLHVLAGEDPVFGWVSATGARPVLQALSGARRDSFEVEYRARLRAAYPRRPFGTLLPFRRVFAVARRP